MTLLSNLHVDLHVFCLDLLSTPYKQKSLVLTINFDGTESKPEAVPKKEETKEDRENGRNALAPMATVTTVSNRSSTVTMSLLILGSIKIQQMLFFMSSFAIEAQNSREFRFLLGRKICSSFI